MDWLKELKIGCAQLDFDSSKRSTIIVNNLSKFSGEISKKVDLVPSKDKGEIYSFMGIKIVQNALLPPGIGAIQNGQEMTFFRYYSE